MPRPKNKNGKTTLGITRHQHRRFRRLLAQTGLQQPVLIDRLLSLGFERLGDLATMGQPAAGQGIRAVS